MMTLTQKFTKLTPKQRENFAAIKDIAELETFVLEQGLDLSEEEKIQAAEYFQNGKLPLDDNDLDAVAGGAAKDLSPELAAADGRTYMLPSGNGLCLCHHQNKWARSCRKEYIAFANYSYYSDIKCYKCGLERDEWNHVSTSPKTY